MILAPLSLSFLISKTGIQALSTSLGGIVGIQWEKSGEKFSMAPHI